MSESKKKAVNKNAQKKYKTNYKKKKTNCKYESGAEMKCGSFLEQMGIKFKTHHKILGLKTKFYDFYFTKDKKKFILEYDGEQHFHFVNKYHNSRIDLLRQQHNDVYYTIKAIEKGYFVIRIDYSQQNEIENHVKKALSTLNVDNPIYLSSTNYNDFSKLKLFYSKF